MRDYVKEMIFAIEYSNYNDIEKLLKKTFQRGFKSKPKVVVDEWVVVNDHYSTLYEYAARQESNQRLKDIFCQYMEQGMYEAAIARNNADLKPLELEDDPVFANLRDQKTEESNVGDRFRTAGASLWKNIKSTVNSIPQAVSNATDSVARSMNSKAMKHIEIKELLEQRFVTPRGRLGFLKYYAEIDYPGHSVMDKIYVVHQLIKQNNDLLIEHRNPKLFNKIGHKTYTDTWIKAMRGIREILALQVDWNNKQEKTAARQHKLMDMPLENSSRFNPDSFNFTKFRLARMDRSEVNSEDSFSMETL